MGEPRREDAVEDLVRRARQAYLYDAEFHARVYRAVRVAHEWQPDRLAEDEWDLAFRAAAIAVALGDGVHSGRHIASEDGAS